MTESERASARARRGRALYNAEWKQPLAQRRFGAGSVRDWFHFCSGLETALTAGLPLKEALLVMTQSSERQSVRRLASELAVAIESGRPFGEALEKEFRAAPIMLRRMLHLASKSGRPEQAVRMARDQFQWMLEARGQIVRVTSYPLMLVILGLGIMAARDVAIAAVQGGDTALAARLAGQHYFVPLAVAAALAIAAAEGVRRLLELPAAARALLAAPFLGWIAYKYTMALTFKVFAIGIEAGLPAADALQLAIECCPNSWVRERLNVALKFIGHGHSLYEALRQTRVVGAEGLGMVAAGEAVAEAPALMRKLAETYDADFRTMLRMMTVTLAPFMLVLVAVGYFLLPSCLYLLVGTLMFLLLLLRKPR